MAQMPMDADLERLLSQAGWLRALAVALLHGRPDAEDAVQEVWAAALRSPPDGSRPPRPWLAQVLRNVVRSGARRSRSERDRDRQAAGLEEGKTAPAAEGVLARMEIQRRVAEQVMALDEPYRTTLLLRYYEGRAAVDIAREQEVPAGTVRWRINEGLRHLRDRLDQVSGGDRERWQRALLPVAGLDPRHAPRLPVVTGGAVLKGAALAVVLGTGTAWLVMAHRAPSPGGGAHDGEPWNPHALAFSDRRTGRTEREDEQMKHERLKRAAVFLGVVLPSLATGAAGASQNAALEQAVVGACIELNERMYECRNDFVDMLMDFHPGKPGQKVTPEQRVKMREQALRDVTEAGSGPLEPRQAHCKALLEGMGERHRKVAESKSGSLKACYAEKDCKARVACVRPILEELHATPPHEPGKK